MAIKCDYLQRTTQTLKLSLDMIHGMESGSKQYEVCRTTVLGSFESCLKRADALLKKIVALTRGDIARLSWQQIVEGSVRQALIPADEADRWVVYHETCHRPAEENEQSFEEDVLPLIEEFYENVCRLLERVVQLQTDDVM